jgi:hypothetical protein
MMTRNEKRNIQRAAKWRRAGRIKVSRGCESGTCPLPSDFLFEPVDLDFDHLNANLKKGNVSDLIRSDYAWITISEEIDKCRVICKICHARHSRATRASYNEHKEQLSDEPMSIVHFLGI